MVERIEWPTVVLTAAVYGAVGLATWAYEALALKLATDPEALGTVRTKLKDNRLKTPLFDTELFARHLERAYALVWKRGHWRHKRIQ